MSSQFEQEHGALLAAASVLLAELKSFNTRLQSTDVEYEQHRVFSERGRGLERQLSAALDLAIVDHYAPAFAAIRPGLEQVIFDRLLFLASKLRESYEDVPEAQFVAWKDAWTRKEPGTEGIISMRRSNKGTVTVERTGLHATDSGPHGPILSVFFFLLRDYDPFMGPPAQQARVISGFHDPRTAARHAKRQQNLYRGELRWTSLLENLILNDLNDAEETLRLDVHYRFLSAFTHPLTDQSRLLYGQHWSADTRYDHCSSELVLLYIILIAALELEGLLAACERAPAVPVRERTLLQEQIDATRTLAGHLWFVGQRPHAHDRVEEANHRIWEPDSQRPQKAPQDLSDNEIRYYRNPLSRLTRLHCQVNELMGYNYAAPWPRFQLWR